MWDAIFAGRVLPRGITDSRKLPLTLILLSADETGIRRRSNEADADLSSNHLSRSMLAILAGSNVPRVAKHRTLVKSTISETERASKNDLRLAVEIAVDFGEFCGN